MTRIVVALILLIGVVLFVLGRPDSPDPHEDLAVPPRTPASSEQEPGRDAGRPAPEASELRRVRTMPFGSAAARGEWSRWIQVRIVRDGDGRPVPGAELSWLAPPTGSMPGMRLTVFDESARQRRLSDSRGFAHLPRQPLRVNVHKDTLSGSHWFDGAEQGPQEIRLHEGRWLRVVVLDANEDPVGGVRVACGMSTPSGSSMQSAVTRHEDGIARLQELPPVFFGASASSDQLAEVKATASVHMPLDRPVRAAATGRELAEGPLTLKLPPTGSLSVSVRDPENQPVRERVVVLVGTIPNRLMPRPANLSSPDAFIPAACLEARLQSGVARFRHVGCLDSLAVTVLSETWEAVTVVGPGPRAGGEPMIGIRLVRPKTLLRGRLLGPQGEPLRNRVLVLRSHGGDDLVSLIGEQRATTTDDEARFELTLDHLGGWSMVGFTILVLDREQATLAYTKLTLRVEELEERIVDRGDIACTAALIQAKGRVVDEQGQPVPRAWVRPVSVSTRGAVRFSVGGPGTRLQPIRGTFTDEQGRFRLTSPPLMTLTMITVTHPVFEPRKVWLGPKERREGVTVSLKARARDG